MICLNFSNTLNIGTLVLFSIIITKIGENKCADFGYNSGSALLLFYVILILEWPSPILLFTNCRCAGVTCMIGALFGMGKGGNVLYYYYYYYYL